MAEIEFILDSLKTVIQCNINDKMKDICNRYAVKAEKDINKIYFVYNGKNLNNDYLEQTFIQNANEIDKQRKKISLLVNEIDRKKENKKIISKEIICPECGENIRMKINNYKINLFDCKNGHNVNLSLKEF